jgi:hypothetical protein
MTCGSIYKIVFPNGKHYIGLTTTSLEQRTKEHKKSAKNGDTKCIYNAIRKYGMVDTLELVEIDTADTIEELCEKEIGYIIEYNSYYMNGGYGYNMTLGGEGTNGYVYTEEDRKKISKSQKKRFENPKEIQKNSERIKKYYEDNPDAIQQNSERRKKYFEDHPEAREQLSESLKKYYENPEAIQKNSERIKKYYEDNPDAREQMSEIKKKHFEDNPDAGREYGEKMKKYYEDNPEARQKCSEIKKKYYEDNPEARRKLSDGKGKNKPFDVFAIDGTFINTFTYQFEAVKYLREKYKITSTLKISEVLSGTRNSSAGFVFKYK